MLKEVESINSGGCIPTFGTIYPILKKLTKYDYAEVYLAAIVAGFL
jgi:hypothetical protein